MANPRTKARIEARIKERAAYCVEFEIKDPRSAFVTITRVEITNDLGAARIFYSVYGSEGEKSRVAHMLADATGFVRKRVGRVLKTRRVPKLSWMYDDSIEYAARMDDAIREALERDREINPEAHPDVALGTEEEPEQDDAVDREYLDFLNAREEEEEGGGGGGKG